MKRTVKQWLNDHSETLLPLSIFITLTIIFGCFMLSARYFHNKRAQNCFPDHYAYYTQVAENLIKISCISKTGELKEILLEE